MYPVHPSYPLTKMTVHARIAQSGPVVEHGIYEGGAQMSQQQEDLYKTLIGDGNARITVGRDLGEKDYGNGGGVFVNVSLVCDQSQAAMSRAIALAYELADGACWYYQNQVKQGLISRGILKS